VKAVKRALDVMRGERVVAAKKIKIGTVVQLNMGWIYEEA
jgi:hypothetical protein